MKIEITCRAQELIELLKAHFYSESKPQRGRDSEDGRGDTTIELRWMDPDIRAARVENSSVKQQILHKVYPKNA